MISETIQKEKSNRQSGYDQIKLLLMRLQRILNAVQNFLPKMKKMGQFDYEEIVDEPLTEENKFKINFSTYILDITLNSLNERFTLVETNEKIF